MFVVQKNHVNVPDHLGGLAAPCVDFPDAVFGWIEIAAAAAEKLLLSRQFPSLFGRFSQVDEMKPKHLFAYPPMVDNAVKMLVGVNMTTLCTCHQVSRRKSPTT